HTLSLHDALPIYEVRAHQSELLEAREWPLAGLRHRFLHLRRGFMEVSVDADFQLVRQRQHLAEAVVGDGVGRVRPEGEAEQRVGAEGITYFHALAQILRRIRDR